LFATSPKKIDAMHSLYYSSPSGMASSPAEDVVLPRVSEIGYWLETWTKRYGGLNWIGLVKSMYFLKSRHTHRML